MSKQITFFLTNQGGGGTERRVPPLKVIPSFCEIKDPRKGKSGRTYIRYISYESSVFTDEQSTEFDVGKIRSSQNSGAYIPAGIKFIEGKKIVSTDEQNLINYLRLCSYNSENSSREGYKGRTITEYNPAKIAKEQMEMELAQVDITNDVRNMPFKMLLQYASLLNVIPSSLEEDLDMDADELRYRMILIAKRDPDSFISGLEDDLYKQKALIMDCISLGVLHKEGSSVLKWSNGERFVVANEGVSPIDVAAQKISEDVEKEKFIKLQIKKQRGNDIIETIKANTELEADIVSTYSTEKVFKIAKDDGVIERSGAYYKFGDTRLSADGIKGESGALQFLKENEHVLQKVRDAIK
jgi:hypothetical protein